jgi:hypothetical protein
MTTDELPMTTETAPLEILPDADPQLLAIVAQNSLAPETAQSLQNSFAGFFRDAKSVLEKSRGIVVTDASQKLEIKLARECRLALRAIRVESDKTRKALKEESLRKGKAIDGFHNILIHLTDAEETRLEEQEKFAERQEAQRKAERKASREAALAPFGIDTTFYQLAEMSDEAWAQLLENTRAAHEAKIEAARKAEEERIRLENERLKEQERIREENARLKREAEEREAAAKVERARLEAERKAAEEAARKEREAAEAALREVRRKNEEMLKAERAATDAALAEERRKAAKAAEEAAAKAKAEREAREKLEQEKRDREAAELKRKQAEEAAREAAAAAPDREKFAAVASTLRAVSVPEMATKKGKALRVQVAERIAQLATWIEEESAK